MIVHGGGLAQWFVGDCRESLRQLAATGIRARTCVTSPPYFGLRDYGHDGQIGLEASPDAYVAAMVEVFRAVRDVLTDDGTLWLNIGDSYGGRGGSGPQGGEQFADRRRGRETITKNANFTGAGIKSKDLIGIPWMLAFALRADGWFLRQEIIWAKGTSGARREGNVMPESVRDRCTKAHETIFLLSKREKYFFDADAIKEPAQSWGTRDRTEFRGGTTDPLLKHHGLKGSANPRGEQELGNRRSVWRCNPTPYRGAHFATFPPALIEPCVLAGSGTTAGVALKHGRHALLCELNDEYVKLMPDRIRAICS